MYDSVLNNADYTMSLQDQRHISNIVDDETTIPAYYFAASYSPTSSYSSRSDDYSMAQIQFFNMKGQSSQMNRQDSDHDSLYDMTDDEAEMPLCASASVKRVAEQAKRPRYPSIIIPSPSAWPTIEKLRSAISALPSTPSHLPTSSRLALQMIDLHNNQIPECSSTPSLDGSMTSEEMDRLSCPSTPEDDTRPSSTSWGVQLDLQAMETLQHLGQSPADEQWQLPTSVKVEIKSEMQEVSPQKLTLTIPSMNNADDSAASTPLSTLSVPSPGGFFSSLQSTARHTWSMPKSEAMVPNTSTAESFYDLPWAKQAKETIGLMPAISDRNSTLAGSTLDGNEDPLPTARPVFLSPVEENVDVKEIDPSKSAFQYNKNYHAKLQEISTANLEMTGRWLEDQDELQSALRDANDISPNERANKDGFLKPSLAKKSVKFMENPSHCSTAQSAPAPVSTYVQGLEYLHSRSQKTDTFIHRQTRAEAMQIQRRCNPLAHRSQLLGKFELCQPDRPAPPRPVSEFFVNDPTVLKERIAQAQMERQALDQMLPIHWVLQAQKLLNGGMLLSKAAHRRITRATTPRILDIGGVVANDWAWDVAYDYPYATVTTTYLACSAMSTNIAGPNNHKHMVVPNLWTLPFPAGHFDVISARTLHELLKTNKPAGRSSDEYDLCLKECYRCLKPGGILDFSLMDADVIHAGVNAQKMSVEFGFNLKTRGYDAQPTKTFMSRMCKAGFKNVHRAWMMLPMGNTASSCQDQLNVGARQDQQEKRISAGGRIKVDETTVFGTTDDAAMLTGIVGSWAWEKWMLKLQMEMGKEEEQLLNGVVQVLEEGAQGCAGWRSLKGWARK